MGKNGKNSFKIAATVCQETSFVPSQLECSGASVEDIKT